MNKNEYNDPDELKRVMSWIGKRKSKKKSKSSRDNLEKARKNRWPEKKTLDKNG